MRGSISPTCGTLGPERPVTASVGLKISKDPKLQRCSGVHIRVSMQDAISD